MIGALRKLFFLTPAVGIAAVFFAATPALAAISPVSISNAQFVAQAYRDVLQRESDPDSLVRFSGQLDQGTLTRNQVVIGLVVSPEYRALQVQKLYLQFLGRPADTGAEP